LNWSFGDVLSNLLLVQNLTYKKDMIGVLWSLPLEVQMYLCLPPLFLLLYYWKPFRGWNALSGMLLLWGIALGLAYVQPMFTKRLNIFQYVPHFLPGVIGYVLVRRMQPKLPAWMWPMWIFALVAAVVVSGYRHAEWIMCLALGLTLVFFRQSSSAALNQMSAWIARYSYGEYLCHMFCIWFAFGYLDHLALAVQWSVFAIGIAGVPIVAFHLLEAPMMRFGARKAEQLFQEHTARAPITVGESVPM